MRTARQLNASYKPEARMGGRGLCQGRDGKDRRQEEPLSTSGKVDGDVIRRI